MLLILLLMAVNSLLVLAPPHLLANWLQLVDMPFQGRIRILEVVMLGLLISWIGEKYMFPYIAKLVVKGVDTLLALRSPELRKGGRNMLKVEKWKRRGKFYKIINQALEEVDRDPA